MRVRRPLAATSLAVALLAATAACGGDDPPPANGSPTDSPSPSATASSTSSPSPSQTEPPQRESAKAFIRRWFKESQEMQVTGDTEAFLAMGKGCVTCESLAEQVATIYRQGGWIRYEGTRVLRITRGGSLGGNPQWDVLTEGAPTSYKESAGSDITHLPGGPTTMRITLADAGDSWAVVRHSVVAE